MNKIVLGESALLNQAIQTWQDVQPGLDVIAVPITHDASYVFDFSVLNSYSPASTTAFVAWDDRFLNLQRYEIFSHIKKLGFSLPPLIHPQACVDPHIEISENVWIGQSAKIGSGAKIGLNCSIGFGASLHPNCQLEEHVTIKEGAIIGSGCELGSFVTIGANVTIKSGTHIGASSHIIKTGHYEGSYPEGTFITDQFRAVIRS